MSDRRDPSQDVFFAAFGDDPVTYPLGEDWDVKVWIVAPADRAVVGALLVVPRWVRGPSAADVPPEIQEDVERGLALIARTRKVPPRGLTARALHKIKLGPLVEARHLEHEAWRRTGRSLFPDDEAQRLDTAVRGRGRRVTRDTLATIAEAYLRALQLWPSRPIVALANDPTLGEKLPDLPVVGRRAWVRDRVAIAREAHFLTRPTDPGRGGGEAGPELLKWREEQRRGGI